MHDVRIEAARRATVTTSSDEVVLIPGFLGFDQFGDFQYFHAAVGDVLRRALGLPIPVQAVRTDPAGSLAHRQKLLLDQLDAQLRARPGVRLHLVGHSTGGLDAELLLCKPLLCDSKMASSVLPAIASVTTIASPLSGTSISDAPISSLFSADTPAKLLQAIGNKVLRGGVALPLNLGVDVLALLGKDAAMTRLIRGVLRGPRQAATYLLGLILRRSLAVDLSPGRLREVWASRKPDPAYAAVPRARFITLAQSGGDDQRAEARLFRRFYESTRSAAKQDEWTESAARLLSQRIADGLLVIGELPQPLHIDHRSNDGIVNTLRQLMPQDVVAAALEAERLKALVIGDHIDVIGYYDGANGAANGFLSSGSSFRTPELERLYQEVAAHIAPLLQPSRKAPSSGTPPR